MGAPLKIRAGRESDLTGIVPFVLDAISETYYRDGLNEQERQSHEDLAKTAPACLAQAVRRHDQKLFVAHVAEELAGFLVLIDLDTEVPELDWFVVARKFQGTGVAQALMDVTLVTVPGYKKIQLGVIHYNTRAQAFYQKNGFRDTGRITGSYLIPRILMIRDTTTAA
jgi:ribosomal protein S18 acetylase RimI-like enzyme